MPEQPARFAELLALLQEHRVEYVLVGALAAALQGAPVSTFDVDIVHRRDPANVAHLLDALRAVHAYYWEHLHARLEPEARTLLLPGHHSLKTDLGGIDVLGTIGAGRGYDDLLGRTTVLAVTGELQVRVLDLDAVIETKREAGRPKDLAALPLLEQVLRESARGESPDK